MARGDGFKRSRWSDGGGWGGRASWRTNYRGWLTKGDCGGGWGALGRMGGRFDRSNWGGRSSMNSALSGSYSAGLSSTLGGDTMPHQSGTGGILSNVSLPIVGGRKLKHTAIDYQDLAEVEEKRKTEITTLVFRYAQAYYSDRKDDSLALVSTDLDNALGVKYARLSRDWVHQQKHVPDMNECSRFVSLIVDAATTASSHEPLSWKIQRAITSLIDRIFRDEQEIQQTKVGTIPTET